MGKTRLVNKLGLGDPGIENTLVCESTTAVVINPSKARPETIGNLIDVHISKIQLSLHVQKLFTSIDLLLYRHKGR